MSISKHNRNKGNMFLVDTTGFEYKTLAELYDAKNPDRVFPVYGLYLGKFYSKSRRIELDCCFAASDGYFISLPSHLVETVQDIRSDEESVKQINNSAAGLTIRPYERNGEQYFTVTFVDVEA